MDCFAFYRTLPVAWAGFTALPTDPDEAVKARRTIRHQLERVCRWVAEHKGRLRWLLGEQVFLELQPDRGTEQMLPEIDRLIAKARNHHAGLVLVDLSVAMRWRRHGPLWDRLAASGIATALAPVPLTIEGETFDPIAHFQAWQQVERIHAQGKPDRRATMIEAIRQLRDDGLSFVAIAAELNAAGLTTPNGRLWRADNVRKIRSCNRKP